MTVLLRLFFCAFKRNNNVAQRQITLVKILVRHGYVTVFSIEKRKRQNVGRAVNAALFAVDFTYLLIVGKHNVYFAFFVYFFKLQNTLGNAFYKLFKRVCDLDFVLGVIGKNSYHLFPLFSFCLASFFCSNLSYAFMIFWTR